MWQQIVFGVFLLAVAGGLSWHSRSLLLQEDRAKMTEEEHRIHRRRAWLRGVGSMLIGLIGVAMLTGLLVGDPRRVLFFWGGVLCGRARFGVVTRRCRRCGFLESFATGPER